MTDYDKWDRFNLERALNEASDDEAEASLESDSRRVSSLSTKVVRDAIRAGEALESHLRVLRLRATEGGTDTMHMRGDELLEGRRSNARAADALERRSSHVIRASRALRSFRASLERAEACEKRGLLLDAADTYMGCLSHARAAAEALPDDKDSDAAHAARAEEHSCTGSKSCTHESHKHKHDHPGAAGESGHTHDTAGGGADHACAGQHCTHSHHRPDPKLPPHPLLDRATLRRAVTRARVDALFRAGTCCAASGSLARAAQVLGLALRSDRHLHAAWVARGHVFIRMGCPLLARLHFETVLTERGRQRRAQQGLDAAMDALRESAALRTHAQRCTATMREWVAVRNMRIAKPPRASDKARARAAAAATRRDPAAATAPPEPTHSWMCIAREARAAGTSLFREGFFQAAEAQFAAAAALVQRAAAPAAGALHAEAASGGGAATTSTTTASTHTATSVGSVSRGDAEPLPLPHTPISEASELWALSSLSEAACCVRRGADLPRAHKLCEGVRSWCVPWLSDAERAACAREWRVRVWAIKAQLRAATVHAALGAHARAARAADDALAGVRAAAQEYSVLADGCVGVDDVGGGDGAGGDGCGTDAGSVCVGGTGGGASGTGGAAGAAINETGGTGPSGAGSPTATLTISESATGSLGGVVASSGVAGAAGEARAVDTSTATCPAHHSQLSHAERTTLDVQLRQLRAGARKERARAAALWRVHDPTAAAAASVVKQAR